MAQLKDLLVTGASRLIGDVFATKITASTFVGGLNGTAERATTAGFATTAGYATTATNYVTLGTAQDITGIKTTKNGFKINCSTTASTLHLYGPTYGNASNALISATTGVFSFGDKGPQITFDSNATAGGGQAGALIYTDNDQAAAGVSWHFVSNQPDWNVISKRFHAKTSLSIGTARPNTSYNLYVNGTSYFTGESKFSSNICRCNNAITKGTKPAAANYTGLWFLDSTNNSNHTGGRICGIEHNVTTAAVAEFRFILYDWAASATANTGIYIRRTATATFQAGSSAPFYGAVWNDYAECREVKEEIEPGRCVIETGKGELILSTERLQNGAEIISDTFGFCIGKTETAKTPIATTGRVLAYPYEDKNNYLPGQPVCSGPNGTISQMTDEEASKYPWKIIGTVSEIPDYEIWHAGQQKGLGGEDIQVNGRIWIRIR